MRKAFVCSIISLLALCAGTTWGQLPSPWLSTDLGSPMPGSVTHSAGTFNITADGGDIWDGGDNGYYVYANVTGDCSVTVRCTGFTGGGSTDGWRKAGVMIREDNTNSRSRHTYMAVTPDNGVAWQGREYTNEVGGTCFNESGSGYSWPVWLRVTRVGNTFTGYYSQNGTTWTQQGTARTIAMASQVHIGMAVTSHNGSQYTIAQFNSVSYTGTVVNMPPLVSVGPDQHDVLDGVSGTATFSLTGSAQDDGLPNPPGAMTYGWTVEKKPAGSTVSFDPGASDLNPDVTVDTAGIYKIMLNASDGEKEANGVVTLRANPSSYDGLVIHYSFDGMTTGDTHVEDVSTSQWSFDEDDNPIHYDHDAVTVTGNPAYDPNIVAGPNGTIVDVLDSEADLLEAIELDPVRRQYVQSELGGMDPNMMIRGGQPRTFMAWVYTRAFNDGGIWDMGSYSDSANFSLRTLTTTNRWRVQYWGGADFDFSIDSLGEWIHFALVYDGTASFILANGQLFDGKVGTINTSDAQPMRIGWWNGYFFDGVIDDFRVYDRALTAQEIIDIADIGNLAPVPDAGPDLRLVQDQAGNSIAITGASVTDIPNNYTVKWTAAGPGTVTFNDDTSESPTVTFDGSSYGLYTLTLTATDGINPAWVVSDDMGIMYQATTGYGLLGMWKLDDGAGSTATDDSGNGYDGTLAGDPNEPFWTTEGKIDGALQFVNSGINIDQGVNLDNVPVGGDLTASFWMKPADIRHAIPIDKLLNDASGVGWNVKLRGDGSVWLQVGSEGNHTFVQSATGQYAADEWTHVAVTFDSASATGKVYLGGLEAATLSGITQTADNIGAPLRLGQPIEAQATTERYQGLLDQVRVYDRVLTPIEVALMAVEDQVGLADCILSIEGAQIPGDANGDCYVDLLDFNIMAGNWLNCTDLNNPSCW
ncbi:MAG: DUF1349 domain-containing protein [Sedimentisphaerales bacterium]|nr:DUF1349 domain-containing protein [Sedimentisphaerales bacterium]